MHRPEPGVRTAVLAILAACAAGTACDADAPADVAITGLEPVPSPAAPGSGEPNLAVGPDGGVYLSWLEPSETGHALRFARRGEGGWSEPRTIIDRPDLFVNWADFPSLAVVGREGDDGVEDDGGGEAAILVAHWLQMSGPGTYSYDIRMALSRDGGETWGDDFVLHRDNVEAEHGFVSLVPLPAQPGAGETGAAAGAVSGPAGAAGPGRAPRLAALWLDGRATVDGDPMTLRFTTIDPSGERGPETPVDASVCDCCQTAMARTASGLVAAYRDRTADEVRDIYVARYVDGAWTEGHPVHDDGWVIAGCPVNGPAVAARGDTVVVAWFTAAGTADGAGSRDEVRYAGERGRVLAAFSTDGGTTFEPPVRVDDGDAMGRVDVLAPGDGAAVVSWLERTADGAEVRVRRVATDRVGPAVKVAGTAAQRASGFPRMVRAGDRVIFAWTAAGDSGGVRTAIAASGPEQEQDR